MKDIVLKKILIPVMTAASLIALALYSLGAFDAHQLEVTNYPDPAGGYYSGTLLNGKYEGQGMLTLPDGDSYAGTFHSGFMDIQGQYISVGKWEYSGTLAEGRPSGKGDFKTADGGIYNGEFRLGDITGDGYFKSKDGWSFSGIFKDGEFVKGELVLKNGSSYEGTFKDHLAHGDGAYFHRKDGKLLWKYEGKFIDGKRHGKGVRATYNPDGKLVAREKGDWINNKLK